ncbi:response regulator transcription factor [Corallococcus sp. 4LFB]|uniref:helix-turn-helix transcriptional regulator n=1 Tax=Corallococcus sp. 4LFB TaxID=3383249 RepID=UPI003975FC32
MATDLSFTSREKRLIQGMQRRLIGVRTFTDIYEAIEEVMLRICKAEHLAVGFSHVDGSRGMEWEAPTVKPLLKEYSLWLTRCFVFQYTLTRPNIAARDLVMLQGRPLESTETYERSRMAGLKLRYVLASLLFENQQQFQGGLAMYKESSKEFTLRDEQLLQSVIPYLNEAVGAVQENQARGFRGDLLSSLVKEPEAGMILNAAGRLLGETGAARDLVQKWFAAHELCNDVPEPWVTLVKKFASMDGIAPPSERRIEIPRGDEKLEVVFKPSNVERPGCNFWEVRMTEHRHWMRDDWRDLLTERELEVADLLGTTGAADKEIAVALDMAVNTVKEHLKAIRRKTGLAVGWCSSPRAGAHSARSKNSRSLRA